jgi:hypothetical protein
MTAFGIRMLGATISIKSSRAIREKRISGEALTTHASLTVDLVLQLLGRHLHNGDAPMRETLVAGARNHLNLEFAWAAA